MLTKWIMLTLSKVYAFLLKFLLLLVIIFASSVTLAKAPWCDTLPFDSDRLCAWRTAPSSIRDDKVSPLNANSQTEAIRVIPLPDTVTVGNQRITGLRGYLAVIKISDAEFGTPQSDVDPPLLKSGNSSPCLEISAENNTYAWSDALLTVEDWHSLYSEYKLMVNANWFDVEDPFKSPHINSCSEIFGLAVSNGRIISGSNEKDRNYLFDSLLLDVKEKSNGQHHNAVIVKNSRISRYQTPKSAVSGFIILKNGASTIENDANHPNSPKRHFARSAVGLSSDGATMYIITEQRGIAPPLESTGSLTAKQMSLLLRAYGASDAINLDNSGSSQFVYYGNDNRKPIYATLAGDRVECTNDLKIACSSKEQRYSQTKKPNEYVVRMRPVVNFLGVKPKTNNQKRSLTSLFVAPYESTPTKQIAGNLWTTKNVNIDVNDSKCYANQPQNCERYGRLYNATSGVQACRTLGAGWELPTDHDWLTMANLAGGAYSASNSGNAAYKALTGNGSLGFNVEYGGKILAYEDHSGRDWGGAYSYDVNQIGYYLTKSSVNNKPGRQYIYTLRSTDQKLLREDYLAKNFYSVRCVWRGER